MILRLLIISLMSMLITGQALANYSLNISDLGSSAEYIAVGGNEAASFSANNVFHNPAQIANKKQHSVSLFTTTLMDEIQFRNIAISTQRGGFTYGFGYMDSLVNGIDETTEITENSEDIFSSVGTYNSSYSVYKSSVAYQLTKKVKVGMTASYFNNKIYTVTGSGFNSDLGISYYDRRLVLAASVKNILKNSVDYSNGGKEPLADTITVSGRYLGQALEPMFQANMIDGRRMTYSIGSVVRIPELQYMDVLVGLRTVNHLDTLSYRMALGFALNLENTSFHFTYEKSDSSVFDHNSYFSLNYHL